MKVSVLIPTKGRPQKLLRCIRSLPSHIEIMIHATCPEDLPSENTLPEGCALNISYGSETVVESFNLLAARCSGAVVIGSDDAEFLPGCIESAEFMLQNTSPRHLIGMNVVNMRCNPDAFALVGRALIEERGFLFNPRFIHFFSDTELGMYARSRNLFVQSLDSKLKNYHPSFSGEYDQTHHFRRREKWIHDKAIWDEIRGITSIP